MRLTLLSVILFLLLGFLSGSAWGQWQSDSESGDIYFSGEGDVGVGTQDPSHLLDLRGGLFLKERLTMGTRALRENAPTQVPSGWTAGWPGSDWAMLVPVHTGTQDSDLRLYVEDDRGDSFSIWGGSCRSNCHDISSSARLAGFSLDHQYLRGKVGIGTRSPRKKLTVAGKVLAEEVVVKPQDEWADYVFEDGYDLPTLEEVSRFVNQEGHLPDVPSAESVEKSGLRLGEMDATLLRKIEELTLYAIEQKERANRHEARADTLNARLQQQRTRNAAQQKQIEAQHRRLDTLEHQNERLRKRLNQLEHYLQNSSPDSR